MWGGVLWFGEDGGVDSADEFGCVSGSVSLEKNWIFSSDSIWR